MVTRLRHAADHLLDFLLPSTCAVCGALMPGASGAVVCTLCWSRLHLLSWPRCARCGHPQRAAACGWCAQLPEGVVCARSHAWVPEGSGGPIVHALKYDGWRLVAREMARRMSGLLQPADAPLIPVPLAASRLRERGFNQSAVLADELARLWDVAVWSHALVRTRATRAQAQLTREQRLVNVADAFSVAATARARNAAHVILVDDVVTTAATLNACANALLAAGARTISYVTFGRARVPGDAP